MSLLRKTVGSKDDERAARLDKWAPHPDAAAAAARSRASVRRVAAAATLAGAARRPASPADAELTFFSSQVEPAGGAPRRLPGLLPGGDAPLTRGGGRPPPPLSPVARAWHDEAQRLRAEVLTNPFDVALLREKCEFGRATKRTDEAVGAGASSGACGRVTKEGERRLTKRRHLREQALGRRMG